MEAKRSAIHDTFRLRILVDLPEGKLYAYFYTE